MTSTPRPWHVVVEFVGVDLDDDDVVDALLAADPPLVVWSSLEGVATAEATVDADLVEDAVTIVLDLAASAVPGAAVVRLVDPLITVADIAEEADVTRQAVRNWAIGTRQTDFPRPVAIVGDGVRVWRMAEVDEWLRENLELGRGHRFPPASYIALFNDLVGEDTVEDDQDGHGQWDIAMRITERQAATVRRPAALERRPVAAETGA